jgi:NAD(P)-dependent dehydrogenase (short-subunit alcohol dehydrogenase family)
MNIPEFDVRGQKVLVVGAGRGIGKGIAQAFAEAGADVAVTGLTTTGVNQCSGGDQRPGPGSVTPCRRRYQS